MHATNSEKGKGKASHERGKKIFAKSQNAIARIRYNLIKNMLPVPPTEEAAATGTAPVESMEVEPSTEASLPGVPVSCNNNGETADHAKDFMSEATVWGWWIFGKLEAAGELIAGILGLNDRYVSSNRLQTYTLAHSLCAF